MTVKIGREEEVKNIYLKRLGKRFSVLKKESGLAYRKIAARCNVDYADVKKYEEGKTDIRFTTLTELAKGYGQHPKRLLEFDWGPEFPPDEDQQLKDRIVSLESQLSSLNEAMHRSMAHFEETVEKLQKQLAEKDKEIERLSVGKRKH